MRGDHEDDGGQFSYISLEERIPKKHPIRKMRKLVDQTLADLDVVFDEMYATVGRPSIPPERLIKASLPQIMYSSRSERQLMDQLITVRGKPERWLDQYNSVRPHQSMGDISPIEFPTDRGHTDVSSYARTQSREVDNSYHPRLFMPAKPMLPP